HTRAGRLTNTEPGQWKNVSSNEAEYAWRPCSTPFFHPAIDKGRLSRMALRPSGQSLTRLFNPAAPGCRTWLVILSQVRNLLRHSLRPASGRSEGVASPAGLLAALRLALRASR